MGGQKITGHAPCAALDVPIMHYAAHDNCACPQCVESMIYSMLNDFCKIGTLAARVSCIARAAWV